LRLKVTYKLLASVERLGVEVSYWDLLDLLAFFTLSLLAFLAVYLFPRLLLRILVGW